MAKKQEDFSEDYEPTEEEILQEEEQRIIVTSQNDLQKFARYANIFEHPRIKDIMPDFYRGDSLIGHIIAIHHYEWRDSFQYKVPFVHADIEIAGYDGKAKAAFFAVPAKTFFKGLDAVGVQLPIVIGIKGQGNTYTFCDPREMNIR